MFPSRTAVRRAAAVVVTTALAIALFPAAANAAGPTFEVATVRAVRPTIAATIAALEAGDLTGARQAEQGYNVLWHGVEVYLNFRSKPTYDVLEGDIQFRLETELAKKDASAPVALGIAKELQAKYEQVVALIEKGAPIGPLFDDLQLLRLNRAAVAQGVVAELNAGNIARARLFWATFATGYPKSLAMISARSFTVGHELDVAVQAAMPAFADPTTTIANLKPLAADVNTKIGVGVSLVNAAARNAVLTKKAVTPADLAQLAALNKVRVALNQSVEAFRAKQYPTAGQRAATAAGAAFDGVKVALAAKKGADVALATALKTFLGAAGPAGSGDATRVESTYVGARNAVLMAQQVLIGQFWSEPGVQKVLATLPAR